MGNKMCDQRCATAGRYYVRAFTTGMYLAGRLSVDKVEFIVKGGKEQQASGFLLQLLCPRTAPAQLLEPSPETQGPCPGCHFAICRFSW